MISRRTLLRSGVAAAVPLGATAPWQQQSARTTELLAPRRRMSPEALASDEAFWREVRAAWRLDQEWIDLYASSTFPALARAHDAAVVSQAEADRHTHSVPGELASERWEDVRAGLAKAIGATPGEVALVRNTTEAMNIVIFGLPLERGDEVVITAHDYDSFFGSLRQRAARDGIVMTKVPVPYEPANQQDLVDRITAAFTPQTRAVMLSQVSWVNGRIYPVAEVCRAARARGIQSIVDGAHGFAHIEADVRDLGCDYYGTSLHKWLAAPRGTGFLYMRQERVKPLWPLMGHYALEAQGDDIHKFEGTGTLPPTFDGVRPALAFHEQLGIERKRARVQYLKEYWATRAAAIPGVSLRTSIDRAHSGGLAFVALAGGDPDQMRRAFREKHRIRVGTVHGYEGVDGVAVATTVFTTTSELDRFLAGLGRFARDGVPVIPPRRAQ